MSEPVPEQVEALVTRWQASGASERANYQMFLSELCDVLTVPRPDPASENADKNLYVFDRAITRVTPDGTASTNYIDFYKAGHFGWETKQGVSHRPGDEAVLEAYGWQHLSGSVGASPTGACKATGPAPCDSSEQVLSRLVAVNHQRAAEEKRGHIRWLRPDYQNPETARPATAPSPQQINLPGTESDPSTFTPQPSTFNLTPLARAPPRPGRPHPPAPRHPPRINR